MNSDLKKLRQADIKVGLVLFAVLVFLLFMTLQFPMSGSYGGVENQWYISPALFPLLLLVLLLLCSLYLVVHGFKQVGLSSLANPMAWIGDVTTERTRNCWYVIFILCAYVYVYIPRVDFYLATVFVVLSLTGRFYLQNANLQLSIAALNILLVVCLMLLSALTSDAFEWVPQMAVADEKQILWADIATSLSIVGLLLASFMFKTLTLKSGLYVFYTAVLTPFILVVVFNFFLYVPMPVEYGTVMTWLNILAYDVIGLGG